MNSVVELDLNYIFTNEFDEEYFREFSINLVNLEQQDFLSCRKTIDNSELYKTHVEYIKDIGKYRDEKNKTILVSMIKLKDSPEKARTMQRNFIAKHIKSLNVDAALVALYSENNNVWRISFVKLDYTFDVEGLKEIITPAKRYSYLIEPYLKNHTAQEQLGKLFYNDDKKPSVEDIEEVFSVQSVTDDFFKMYKEKYLDLKELLESCSSFIDESKRLNIKAEDFSEEFAKKLMGQISFLYFLQKKGWLGVKIVPKKIDVAELEKLYNKQDEETRNIIKRVYYINGNTMHLFNKELKILNKEEGEQLASVFKNTKYDKEWGSGTKSFIKTIFNTAEEHNFDFFNDYLEPLFYNALNKKRGNTEYYHLFNCKIPFLNGGLFEPIYNYQWEKINIQIPNKFFSNEDGNGLLDLFDMYNFTINEDEPLEKEVAVDPEMLGKIFENLLEIKERKSKGAFYTPREIVHYMCQESLINYLVNKTNIDEKSIELFIKYGDIIKDEDFNKEIYHDYRMPKVVLDNINKIDEALATVTVADPAVGSGAFPLGMVSEIVKLRSIITEYLTVGMNEGDKRELFEKRSIYQLKKDTMKKSIFAVDIEPSAIDIAKLRLWLSLVVDAEVKTVNTLPNLDYNIMVGNSLIDEYEGIKLFDEELLKQKPKRNKKKISNQIQMNFNNSNVEIGVEQEAQILEDIQVLQSKLFDIKVTSEKLKIKEKIEQKEWELIEYKLAKENKQDELKNLKKTRYENRRPYFLWELEFSKIFRYNQGFDIVIGNPPYIGEKGNKNIFREIAKTKFGQTFYKSKMDIFYFFFHKALNLCKYNGFIGFITTNYYFSGEGAIKLRKDLFTRSNIIKIINFNELKIFESALGQHNCISFLNKSVDENFKTQLITTNKKGTIDREEITNILEGKDNNLTRINKPKKYLYQGKNKIIDFSESDDDIINKMEINGELRLNKDEVGNGIDILQECVTDKHMNVLPKLHKGQGIFAINNIELNELGLKNNEMTIIKPYYTSQQISKFAICEKNYKWIIYTDKEACKNIDKYGNIKNHLDKFYDIITSDNKPYGLHRARNESFFKGEKILCARMTKQPCFTYTDMDTYVTRSYLSIKTERVNMKYLTGILNSDIIYYWLFNKGKRKGMQLQVDKQPLLEIPISLGDKKHQDKIILITERIIECVKNKNDNYEYLIKSLNEEIYKIYKLNKVDIEKINSFIKCNNMKS